jgi:hypothetical protein
VKKRSGTFQIQRMPDGLEVSISLRLSFEEIAAVLTPKQIAALLEGIGRLVKEAKTHGTAGGTCF